MKDWFCCDDSVNIQMDDSRITNPYVCYSGNLMINLLVKKNMLCTLQF